MENKKLLIYRRGGLGDTLLTFPVAEVLKKLGWKVWFVGNTDYLKLAKETGFIEGFFSEIPPNLETFEKVILFARENFLNIPKAEVVTPFPKKEIPVLEHYLKSLNLPPIYSQVLPLEDFPFWKGRVILHPGSGSMKKNAPLELFKKIYQKLKERGEKPLIVLGEAELNLRGEFKKFETYRVEDILTFAKLLKGAKAFIGNDSGFSHLAGYLGVKTLALFGPTNPKVWSPLGPHVKVLYKNLSCSPCFPKECTNDIYKECLLFGEGEILSALFGRD